MELDLSTGTTASPERTLQLAKTMAEIVRVLNHATRDHAALQFPSEADRLLRELSTAASRLPQLLGQVAVWLQAENEAGRIEMAPGQHAGDPSLAADLARIYLDEGASHATALQRALDAAASVTCDMGARWGEDDW